MHLLQILSSHIRAVFYKGWTAAEKMSSVKNEGNHSNYKDYTFGIFLLLAINSYQIIYY